MEFSQAQYRRSLRYAIGVTLAAALAFGFAWPLSFLLPVLTAVILALPVPRPTLKQGIMNYRDTLLAFGVGFVMTQFIMPHTVIYIPLLGMALFHTYYHLNRGGSFWLVMMLLICLLLMPMLATVHEGLAIGVASGLVGSSLLALVMLWVSHYLVPDIMMPEADQGQQPETRSVKARPGFQAGYSAPAAMAALKSTAVALPVALLFLANNWTNQILVIVFAAIFTLAPDLDKGRQAGLKSIASTLIGGGAAFVVYWLLVAVPEYFFLVVLMFIVSLGFGRMIYAGRSVSRFLPSAMVAMIILVNSSLAEDADLSENFVLRVIYISLASVYVVTVLKILGAYWPARPRVEKPVSI